ncbi:response regulator [Gracilibacillus halophilus]|nr:response regulator transcription factor [Gracilibacillus halophilus]
MMKTTVVIADDQQMICDGLEVILMMEGDFEVLGSFQNGQDVIDFVQTQQPDVILMDIRMPGIGGIAATHQIKQMHPSIKIIMLTTFSQDEYMLEALKSGANGYILKDAGKGQLISSIRHSLSGQVFIPEKLQPALIEQLNHTDIKLYPYKTPLTSVGFI